MAQASATVSLDRTLVSLVQDSEGVTVGAPGSNEYEQIRAKWLVGTNGAASTVRKLINLSSDGMTSPERFVATNLKCDVIRGRKLL
jgi:3-(3-hydroxy-phenyl)propionate hydroxylase